MPGTRPARYRRGGSATPPTSDPYDIEVDPETITVAWSKTLAFAESFRLSVYDAAYLELALRRGLPLASLDDSLRTTMQRAGGRLLARAR